MRKSILIFLMCGLPWMFFNCFAQNVGINATGAPASTSAGLDVDFTNKGVLIPRLNTSQRDAIGSPVEGLQIYNTSTKCFEFYADAHWQPGNCSCPAIGAINATISGATTVCPSGLGYVYSIPQVAGASAYNWSVSSGSGAPTITSGNGKNSITVTAGTNAYNVSVTTVNACGTSSATAAPLAVSMNAVPSVPGAIVQGSPSGTAVCQGQTGVTYTVTNVGGLTYNWTVPFGSVTSGSGTNSITVTVGASASSGSVSVTATNSCGQTSSATTLPVTVNFIPAAPSASAAGSIAPTSFSANWAASSGATTYYLDVSTDESFGSFVSGYQDLNVGNVTTYSVASNITCNTVYHYRVRAGNTCGTGVSSGTIDVTSGSCCTGPPATPGAITGNTAFCSANQTYSISSVSGATSYTWSVPSGSVTSGQGTISINATLGSTGGNVSVTASNACGTSSASTLGIVPMTGWQYFKPITVSNSSGSNLSNYQVKVTVSYVAGKMNSNFSDLRFISSSGSLLNYWIESYSASSSATVWMKVPSVPTSGTTVYMYYGNSSATTTSSGPNTFILFDDFNISTVNTSLWAVTGTVSQSGGLLRLGDASYSHDYVESILSYGPGVAFYSYGTIAGEDWTDCDYGFVSNGPNFHKSWSLSYIQARNNTTAVNSGYNKGQTASWEIQWKPDGTANFYVNGGSVSCGGAWTTPATVRMHQGGPAGITTSDLCYIRSYVTSEPSGSFGSEQACP